MFEAKVLADSISHTGVRLTTVQLTYPRFIHSEVMTHRVFSRNAASSRAIPPEKMIAKVAETPFIPETFNERVKGMGVGAEFSEAKVRLAREIWLEAARNAVSSAQKLNEIGLDKSRINRLLEPFLWYTAIISSTEWDNYFALRCPTGDEVTTDFPAQLEFQRIAIEQRNAMRASKPERLGLGEWHLPLVTKDEISAVGDDVLMLPPDQARLYWPMVSAGRCARVSYDTHENAEELHSSYQRAVTLRDNGHMSPFEHVATPVERGSLAKTGNYRGWQQLRQQIPFEHNRIGYLEDRLRWDEPVG